MCYGEVWNPEHGQIQWDVDSAYKLPWVRSEDVCQFATELPEGVFGSDGEIFVMSLSLVFGWGKAPGEYMSFAWTYKQTHQTVLTRDSKWDSDVLLNGLEAKQAAQQVTARHLWKGSLI